MLERKFTLLLLCFLAHWRNTGAVDWKNGSMAKKCDFYSRDVGNVKSKAESCYNICANSTKCTHFTWSLFNNGTCWLKCGNVSKKDAIDTKEATTICGIVNSTSRPIKIKSYTDSCNKFNVKPGHRLADERPNTRIAWKGHWAFDCTFVGESFAHSKLDLGKCIALCQVTSECTHFNWNRRLNSTCYMRSGPASKDNAVITNDNSFACGLKMTIE